jgi:hypothetical protein
MGEKVSNPPFSKASKYEDGFEEIFFRELFPKTEEKTKKTDFNYNNGALPLGARQNGALIPKVIPNGFPSHDLEKRKRTKFT